MAEDAEPLKPERIPQAFKILDRPGEGQLRQIANRRLAAATCVVVDDLTLVGKRIERPEIRMAELRTAANDQRATSSNPDDVHLDIADRDCLNRGFRGSLIARIQ